MRIRGLKRVCSDFRRHPWLHFISITTITVALVLVGAFLIFFRNVETVAEKTNPRMTGTVYLREGLDQDQIRELRDKVFSLEQVRQVVFKDRDSVVSEIQGFLGEAAHKKLPGSEVFPDVLEIELDAAAKPQVVEMVQKSILAMAGVQEVDFSDGWLAQYKKIRNLGKLIGVLLLAAIMIGCGFIIANFMVLRHQDGQARFPIKPMLQAVVQQ
ncbi:permease-like cell division protein FtsX, partial [bacterium]|nr:permease-like cell division protein FtsX [bacterium]